MSAVLRRASAVQGLLGTQTQYEKSQRKVSWRSYKESNLLVHQNYFATSPDRIAVPRAGESTPVCIDILGVCWISAFGNLSEGVGWVPEGIGRIVPDCKYEIRN